MHTASTIARHRATVDECRIGCITRLQQFTVIDVSVGTDASHHARSLRSYYPLNGTIAQTALVLAGNHRSGNPIKIDGAKHIFGECMEQIEKADPQSFLKFPLR